MKNEIIKALENKGIAIDSANSMSAQYPSMIENAIMVVRRIGYAAFDAESSMGITLKSIVRELA